VTALSIIYRFVPELKKYCGENSVTFEVLLILHNILAHDLDVVSLYPNIDVVFPSPRSTSVMDPVDQFVITVLKDCNLKLIAERGTRNDKKFGKSKSHNNWRSVGQSVSQGIEPALGLVTRYCFLSKVVFWNLLSCLCGAPSLTRGRVCHLSFSV
jgi:hypothetical protein